jgi:TPR repeat protein
VMYAAGQGVPPDQVEAYAWLHRAGAAGLASAARYLQRVAARMSPAMLAQADTLVGSA